MEVYLIYIGIVTMVKEFILEFVSCEKSTSSMGLVNIQSAKDSRKSSIYLNLTKASLFMFLGFI
jgi:hypothetical protein